MLCLRPGCEETDLEPSDARSLPVALVPLLLLPAAVPLSPLRHEARGHAASRVLYGDRLVEPHAEVGAALDDLDTERH